MYILGLFLDLPPFYLFPSESMNIWQWMRDVRVGQITIAAGRNQSIWEEEHAWNMQKWSTSVHLCRHFFIPIGRQTETGSESNRNQPVLQSSLFFLSWHLCQNNKRITNKRNCIINSSECREKCYFFPGGNWWFITSMHSTHSRR